MRKFGLGRLGAARRQPPLLSSITAVIASKESRDIVHNIQVLDAIASTPAPM